MFGHKSYLRLGAFSDSGIAEMYKDSYELKSCNYSFSKGIDQNGKAQTRVIGGAINVIYPALPTKEMLQWALDSRKYHDGMIVICDENDQPLEKIQFENAACVGLEINYSKKRKEYANTKLVLRAFRISVGTTYLNNRWTGFE